MLNDVKLALFICVLHVMAALALKGVEYEYRAVNLVKDGGQQVLSEWV